MVPESLSSTRRISCDLFSLSTRTNFGGRNGSSILIPDNNTAAFIENKICRSVNDGQPKDATVDATLYKLVTPPGNVTRKSGAILSLNSNNNNQLDKSRRRSNRSSRSRNSALLDDVSSSVFGDHAHPKIVHSANKGNCSFDEGDQSCRQRNGFLPRRPLHMKVLLTILSSACLLESTRVQARQLQQHEYLFPGNDEYDAFVLDASNIYGSPMGGFSRATKSRLASRPLKLPYHLVQDDDNGDASSVTESDFWEIADGVGRRYACRVFNEDEVEPTSLVDDSLYDPPIFRLAVDLENEQHKDLGERIARVVGSTNAYLRESFEEGSSTFEPLRNAWSKLEAVGDSIESIEFAVESESEFEELEVDRRLDLLEGACIQKEIDYWTYEWCWKKKVQRFHVHVVSNDPRQPKIKLEDVTNLGYYSVRDIKIRRFLEDVDEIGRVEEKYRHGESCNDEEKRLKTDIHMHCCSENTTKGQGNSATLLFGAPVDFTLASITTVWEDPKESCKYHVDICTPILCHSTDSDGIDDLFHAFYRYESTKVTYVKSHTSSSASGTRKSVMEILDEVLRGDCLYSRKDGWWRYEYCHKRHVRQYSGPELFNGIDLDDDSQYLLGFFRNESDILRGRKDWERVVNVTDSTTRGPRPGVLNRGGNGAYYEIEFGEGEICIMEDAKEEDAVEKKKRACTVRFSCGEEFCHSPRR